MTAISLTLPNDMAQASFNAARQLGVSRTQFIRQAIEHELENFQAQLEQQAMAQSFSVMKSCPDYWQESEEIEGNLNTTLPDDENQWWTQKS